MQRIFLLRAYGDFVIALQAIYRSNQKIQIVASDHLAPLYHALIASKALQSLSIEFIALGIKQGQLNFFTNKHLLSWDTSKQLSRLKAYIKSNPNQYGVDWVEHEIRMHLLNFLLGHRFKAVVSVEAKVYQAYDQWLELESAYNQLSFDKTNEATNEGKSFLIFPDARLKKKIISNTTIAQLKHRNLHRNSIIKIARFNNSNHQELSYTNFEELIDLIRAADYIYTSDSAPAHLANFLAIPHSIIYQYKSVNRFCTPYSLENKSYMNLYD